MMHDLVLCPSCLSGRVNIIGEIPCAPTFAGRKLKQPLPGGYLYSCDACELLFRFPRLDKEEMDTLYSDGAADNWAQDSEDRADWRIALNALKSRFKGGDILDIGCYDGRFLSNFGPDFARYGIEINEVVAEIAAGRDIRILGRDFSVLKKHNNSFDVVTAFDVMEHVFDPLSLVKEMAGALRKEGIMIVSTGNAQAPSWRLLKSRYWYCCIAEHVSFISPSWCKRHAASCGLEVQSIDRFSHCSKSQNSIGRRIKQFVTNILYGFSPRVLSRMRQAGFGGLEVGDHHELLDYPPDWKTAKDHFMVTFRKI